MKIRPFVPGDLAGLTQIQDDVALGGGWRGHDYARIAEMPGGLILVAEEEQIIVGFIASSLVFDQAEVLNMAVAAKQRRQGIGRQLLIEICRRLTAAGARSVWLEARVSNLPAIQLYKSFGFIACKTRKNYYSNPIEDACVMRFARADQQAEIEAGASRNFFA